MDSIATDPKTEEIYRKFQVGMQANQEWFMEEARKVKPGEHMPYDPRFGITQDEYDIILNSAKNIKLLSTGTQTVKIIDEGDRISFISAGKLEILNNIKINLKENIILFGDEELKYKGISDIKGDDNAFGSKWKAHTWELNDPSDAELEKLSSLQNITGKRYNFQIGLLETLKKRFIKIKGIVLENGAKKMDFEIPIEF
jgi:hypothetical protein